MTIHSTVRWFPHPGQIDKSRKWLKFTFQMAVWWLRPGRHNLRWFDDSICSCYASWRGEEEWTRGWNFFVCFLVEHTGDKWIHFLRNGGEVEREQRYSPPLGQLKRAGNPILSTINRGPPPSFSRMIHPMIPVLVANLINTGQSIIQWSAMKNI